MRALGLWFGVSTGPIAWGLHILLSWGMEEIACSPAATEPDILGVPLRTAIMAESIALIVIIVVAGAVCWSIMRAARPEGAGRGEWVRWTAFAGLISNVVFLLLTVLETVPVPLLELCRPSL